ncbi:MAG: DNA repair protein RecO, partial [Myxococcales bacterium]|nr:DNA repair protein RecO [Myxococcales bacterium]
MPREQFRCQAIVLARRELGEADRRVTLLTRDFGKLEALARGARR